MKTDFSGELLRTAPLFCIVIGSCVTACRMSENHHGNATFGDYQFEVFTISIVICSSDVVFNEAPLSGTQNGDEHYQSQNSLCHVGVEGGAVFQLSMLSPNLLISKIPFVHWGTGNGGSRINVSTFDAETNSAKKKSGKMFPKCTVLGCFLFLVSSFGRFSKFSVLKFGYAVPES